MSFEEDCCSCHISPPCSYCTSHSICEKCGKDVLNECIDEDLICDDCKTVMDNEQHIDIEQVSLTCPFCGEEIPASKGNKYYCPKCSGEWLLLPLPELMKWPED